ncbi:MAG: phosphoglucosamine mutase [Verrucomicrobiota bacterium]
MKRHYFGTDGVRGPYGSSQMNEELAWRLGVAAARFAQTQSGLAGSQVMIGRDTRGTGPALAEALAAGLASAGLQPVSLGVVPTPIVSLLTRQTGAALGAVITASHNPASDNGIKFFGVGGIKLTDEAEWRIEQLMPPARAVDEPPLFVAAAAEKITSLYPEPLKDYLALTTALLPAGSLKNWSIVLDTANGAAAVTSRTALAQLGAALTLIGHLPDGENINAGVGSQHPERLSAAVRAAGARLGIAHDGDADRCVLCDEQGNVLDGDELLTILAVHALQQNQLAGKILVITVQSNLGVDAAVAAAGGRTLRTAVGDRYVIEGMRAAGAQLGGESSGHVICADISPTGDGLVAALKVIAVMQATGRPLSELRRVLVKFPQLSLALTVQEKKSLELLPTLSAAINTVTAELGASGRVLVRYSGTEPKLRLLVEGPTLAVVTAGLARLNTAARADLVVL